MLEARNLEKIYKTKKGSPVTALKSINVSFAEKGLVFLLGKSGSGKSTLLNLLGGLDSISGGEIIIKGKSSAKFSQSDFDSYRNTFIGFIFQEFYILEDYSVGRNIGLSMELQHKKADNQAIEKILAQVDLEGYANRNPNELSGGQKQRVAIARALIKNPEIIMADEPTGSLDSTTGKQVFETLKKLAQEKLVIVVSHDRENAELYGDRIIELSDGVIIKDRIKTEGGMLKNQPINYLSDKLVMIKAGNVLTAEDIKKINQMLEKSSNDIYISADEKSNTVFASEITSANDKTFVAATKENIHVKAYQGSDFNLVKSRLPLKDSIKMGVSGLKLKKIRLAFTIILSFVAFTMFGISNTVASFNADKTELNTMYRNDNLMLSVEAQIATYLDMGGKPYYTNNSSSGRISDQHIADLERMTQSPALKVLNMENRFGDGSSGYIMQQLNEAPMPVYAYYNYQNIARLVEVPNLESANLTRLAGKLPAEQENYDEIGISDYVADIFIKYGFKEYKALNGESIASYDNLLGKKLTISYESRDYDLKISGIFKTDLNTAKWEKYKTMSIDQLSFFDEMTFSALSNMLLCMGFVKPGFSAEINNVNNDLDEVYIGSFFQIQETENYIETIYAYNPAETYFGKANVAPLELEDDEIVVHPSFFGIKETDRELSKTRFDDLLASGPLEAEFSISYFKEPVKIVGISFSENKQYISANQTLMAKLEKNYSKATSGTAGLDSIYMDNYGFGNFDTSYIAGTDAYNLLKYDAEEIHDYAFNNIYWGVGKAPRELADDEIILSSDFFENNFGKGEISLTKEQRQAMFDEMLLNGQINAEMGRGTRYYGDKTMSFTISEGIKVKVAAITFDNYTYISETLFQKLQTIANMPQMVIIKLTGNQTKDMEILKYLKSTEVIEKYSAFRLGMKTMLSPVLESVDPLISVFKNVFFYASIVFSVFAGLLLMNFIGVSVNAKRKDIGILRAIGARSADIFRIFFSEGIVIALINSLLSTVALVILSLWINSLVGISLLVPGVLQVASIFLLCFGVTFLATFIPVRKIAVKKPIDAINNK